MGKIAEKKENKKNRLMETAFELYTTQGIIRTSISDIVEKSGIAKGTFYLYFKDKYDLREHLVIHKTEQLFEHALVSSGYQQKATPNEKILAIMDDIIEELDKDKALLRFISKNLSWGLFKSAMSHTKEEKLAFLQDIMQNTDPRQMEIAAYMIFELVGSSCFSVILEEDPVDLAGFKPYLNCAVSGILDSLLKSDL